MKELQRNHIRTKLLAVILGGVCLYVYLCFAGVFTVFLIDIGYYNLELKAIRFISDSSDLRSIIYWFSVFLKDFAVQILISMLFLYWFSVKLRKGIAINTILLSVGALIANFLIYHFSAFKEFDTFFSYSSFFESTIFCYLFNIFLWCIIFFISILMASKVRTIQIKAIKITQA
jgi:hypothetical protein